MLLGAPSKTIDFYLIDCLDINQILEEPNSLRYSQFKSLLGLYLVIWKAAPMQYHPED